MSAKKQYLVIRDEDKVIYSGEGGVEGWENILTNHENPTTAHYNIVQISINDNNNLKIKKYNATKDRLRSKLQRRGSIELTLGSAEISVLEQILQVAKRQED